MSAPIFEALIYFLGFIGIASIGLQPVRSWQVSRDAFAHTLRERQARQWPSLLSRLHLGHSGATCKLLYGFSSALLKFTVARVLPVDGFILQSLALCTWLLRPRFL